MSIKAMVQLLPANQFMGVHHSVIVPPEKMNIIDRNHKKPVIEKRLI
ncbi:hypothetical protein [Coprobacter tertius]|uniref:Uncharacterized protein n=1 Tax=Coprobacter tertius TaxID=2944915 RepID=A0ABT1MNT3_9BACT|nr:hypothetical protein [Coprobacter tertius]MCP9612951.1 hypothetical protein [Coprobacter tertius]